MSWNKLDLTWHYVEKWAAETPGSEALVFGGERKSWLDFKNEMDLVAKAYIAAGVEKGDRVAMLSMARNEFLTTYMAAGKAGAMWLGLSPKFTAEELEYQVGDSKPKVLITLREYMGEDLAPKVRALMDKFSFINKVLVIGEPFEGAESFGDFIAAQGGSGDDALAERAAGVVETDNALLLYTSGSTGKPKGVVHTHRAIVENIRVEVPNFHFEQTSRALLHFPINHVAADVEIGFGIIMAGGCIVCMERFDPALSLRLIEEEKITIFGQVPVMYLLEMKMPEFKTTDFSSLKQIIWGGAAAPEPMIKALAAISEKTGAGMITGYGSTEICGFITYTKSGDSIERLMKSVGPVAQGFEVRIVDDNRREVPRGTVGELACRGPFLMKEYLNRPDATAEVFDSDGWFYTSDLAYMDEEDYIYLTGRKSEMFKTGGENVFPREIEDVLEKHPDVVYASVVSVPDDIFQEVGWAFIMKKPGVEIDPGELRELCKSKLANFKVPKKFIIRDSIPLLGTGKVNKRELKSEAKRIMEQGG